MKDTPRLTTALEPRRYRRRIFGQLWTLAAQFVLGMLLNIIGSEVTGSMHVVYVTVLVLHIVTAIGLVEGGVYLVLKKRSRLNWWTLGVLIFTFVCGSLTAWTGNNIWSLLMAFGFLAAGWLYVVAYVRADRVMRPQG